MSPMTVIDAQGAVSTGHGASVSVRTPARARPGLHLIAILVWPDALTPPAFEDDGWDELGAMDNVAILRRAIVADEAAHYDFAFEGELDDATDPPAMAALLVATGVLDNGAASSFESEALAAAGPDLTATGAIATRYDDGALSIFAAAADDGFEDDDREVLEVTGQDTLADTTPVAGSLLVWFDNPESAGPVGDREATLEGGAPCNAIVAQATLLATPPLRAPQWDGDGPTIGLPRVGV